MSCYSSNTCLGPPCAMEKMAAIPVASLHMYTQPLHRLEGRSPPDRCPIESSHQEQRLCSKPVGQEVVVAWRPYGARCSVDGNPCTAVAHRKGWRWTGQTLLNTRACGPTWDKAQDGTPNRLPQVWRGFVVVVSCSDTNLCSSTDSTTGGGGAATVCFPRRDRGGELTEPRSKPRDIVVSPAVFDFSLLESSLASSTPGRGGAPGLLSC